MKYDLLTGYDGISFPMKLRDIPKFEKLNNLRINVYAIVSKNPKKSIIALIFFSDNISDNETIHLLAVDISENDNKKKR